MAKNKLINSGFWSDPFIEDLSLQEKALFLYFITNELVSLSGIYPISKKRICFDTEINKKKLNEILKKFSENNKIHWVSNFIIVVNFLKYQKPNPKMIVAIEKEFSRLPFDILLFLKDNLVKLDSLSIGYQRVSATVDTHLKTKTKTNTNINTNININNIGQEEEENPPKPVKKVDPFIKHLQNKIIENNFVEIKDHIFEFYQWRMNEKIKGQHRPYETEKGINGLFRNLNGCRDAGMIVSECIEIAMEKPWLTPDPSYFNGRGYNNNQRPDGGLDWLEKRKAARARGDIK